MSVEILLMSYTSAWPFRLHHMHEICGFPKGALRGIALRCIMHTGADRTG